jgi:4'-phosphopantetheinyl transferase
MQLPCQELDSVIVGLTQLPGSPIAYPHLEAALSGPDRDRAGRFRVPEDRARFVIGRRLLAALLHEHLHHPPGPLELALTERGRPHLPDAPATAFSISHAGSLVAVALATGGRVGIDVESLRGRIDLAALAKRIHNPADLARFAALPDADKPGAFFRAWTGKEAILKAKGTGLSGDMKAISVPLNSAITHVHETGASWQLQPLPVPAGYVGAIAWDDPGKAIRLRHYETSELK